MTSLLEIIATTLNPLELIRIYYIIQSAEHLLNLINDILSFSKTEAGQTLLMPEEFNLHETLNIVQDLFVLAAQQKGLGLIFDLDPELPQAVYLDEKKVRQILINLLSNAIKFTEVGQVTLKVTYGKTRQTLHFAVMDTGPGIDPSELNKLFQVFQQTSTGLRSRQGTGLGLAISQQFVRLMGGEIYVETQLDQGSCFWFELPIAQPDASAPSREEAIATQS